MFLEGLLAAERNSGEHHLGTLTTRTWLAHLYWRQERYSDALRLYGRISSKSEIMNNRKARMGNIRIAVGGMSMFTVYFTCCIRFKSDIFFVQEFQLRENYTF